MINFQDFLVISGDSHDDSNDESSISVSSQSENNASPMMLTTYTITPNYQCKLIDFHKNVDEFSRQYFKDLIEDLKAQFEQFARTEESFNRLSLNDQSKLLEFNTPLYVQYLIAGYCNESTGSGQIQVCIVFTKKKIAAFLFSNSESHFSGSSTITHPMTMTFYYGKCLFTNSTIASNCFILQSTSAGITHF